MFFFISKHGCIDKKNIGNSTTTARETFAPVWYLSEAFILTNLVIKSLQKIRFENIQNRRPYGSLIKHGGFWGFFMCRASVDDQSPDIPFRIRWTLGNSIRSV